MKQFVLNLIPKKMQKFLFGYYWTVHSPDRQLLVREILPRFAKRGGKILWVGCERYTKKYPAILERDGGVCWTLEIDPEKCIYGGSHHIIGDLLDLDKRFGENTFDSILCNGVFGFGVDSPEQQQRAFDVMRKCLKNDGVLLLGWSSYRPSTPSITIPSFFKRTEHIDIPKARHAYEFLTI